MSDDMIGSIVLVVAIVLTGAVSTWLFRLAAAKRAGSGVVQVIVWARSGLVPGPARPAEEVDQGQRERGRVRPPGMGQAGGRTAGDHAAKPGLSPA